VQFVDGSWEEPEEDGPPTYAGYGAAEIALSTRVGDHATTGQDTTEREIPLAQINTSTVNGSKLFGTVTWAMSGIVETDAEDPSYLGAAAHTNNTGELSALYYSIRRALTRARHAGSKKFTVTQRMQLT
jgi:hypothetical protein